MLFRFECESFRDTFTDILNLKPLWLLSKLRHECYFWIFLTVTPFSHKTCCFFFIIHNLFKYPPIFFCTISNIFHLFSFKKMYFDWHCVNVRSFIWQQRIQCNWFARKLTRFFCERILRLYALNVHCKWNDM